MSKNKSARYIQNLLGLKYTYAKKWWGKREAAILHTAGNLPYDGTHPEDKIKSVIHRWLEAQPYDADLEISTSRDSNGYPFEYSLNWLEEQEKNNG